MENVKQTLRRSTFLFAILVFFFTPELYAQNDILELCTDFMTCYRDDCSSDTPLQIDVDYNASDDDTAVIIHNFAGYRLFNPVDTDRKYKFCAANTLCSTSDTDPGEFHIRFEINGSLGGVNRINFSILNPSAIDFSVSSFQGITETVQSGTVITGGRSYALDDAVAFDSIKVTSVHSSGIDASNLFELDQVYFPPAPSSNSDPTDISLSSNTVDENASLATVVGGLTTTDADAGDTHTYTLVPGAGDTDNSRFEISGDDLITDEVFNYEATSSYSVRIQTDDGNGGTYSKQFTINIVDVTEPASFTINTISNTSVVENSSYTSATPVINGTPIGNVSYTIHGADAAYFTHSPTTGVVLMVARDFENPEDDNADNVYELTIRATDEDGNTADMSWTVTVTDFIEPATFTINTIDDIDKAENSAYTSATPSINGAYIGNITYTLLGADASDFTITSTSGVVQMVARDFEIPADANTNNIYEVTIRATDDDGNFDEESWTVTITNVPETTTFAIDEITDISVDENVVYTGVTPSITGSPIGAVTYTLLGVDAEDFTITPGTGVVQMIGRDYENPVDANTDNVYLLTIRGTDTDENFDEESWTVTVSNADEPAVFTINTINNANVDENSSYTGVTPTISGTYNGSLTYTLLGVDAGDFTISSSTGVVSMVARDFENPADENTDNIYEITIRATDGDNNFDDESWTVTVNNIVGEGPPEIVCVLDLSGSMNRDFHNQYTSNINDRKLEHAKSALTAFVDLLYSFNPDAASMGLARFPNSPSIGCDAGSIELLQLLDETYKDNLLADIPVLIADGGSTPLMASLDFAMDMFNSDNNKVIVLLSDGRQNCPTTHYTDVEIDAYESALTAEGITLYTIGFGLNSIVPNNLLEKLSDNSDGEHYNITAISDKSPVYDPNAPSAWDPRTALHAVYATIMTDGLDLEPCTDPLEIINQGELKQISIPITRFDDKVCFFVSWVTPQDDYLLVSLKKPDGDVLSLDQNGITSVKRYNHTIITLTPELLNQDGMLGNWTLEVDASEIGESMEHMQYSVINSSRKLRFDTWFDKDSYFIGDEMKIFAELLLEDHPVNDIDGVIVKGTAPGIGFGNWLTGTVVTKEEMLQIQSKTIEDYLNWDKEQAAFRDLDPAQQKIYLEKRRRSYIQNFDSFHLRASTLTELHQVRYPKRVIIKGLEFRDDGTKGDAAASDGIFTAVHIPEKEGSYQFYFAANHGRDGKLIQRESQLQSYVNVKIELQRFIEKVTRIEMKSEKEDRYMVILNLKDRFGNVPTPDALSSVSLSLNKGKLMGGIILNEAGEYTQLISLEKGSNLKSISMTMTIGDRIGKQTLMPSYSKWFYIIIGLIIIFFVLFNRRKK